MATEKTKRHFLIAEVDRDEKQAVERHAKAQELTTGELIRQAIRYAITGQIKEKVA